MAVYKCPFYYYYYYCYYYFSLSINGICEHDCLQLVSVFLSAFTLLAISVDRYQAVIFPLRPRPTIHTALAVIVVTWSAAIIASLPVAVFARVTRRVGHDGTQNNYCEEVLMSSSQ